MELDGEKVGWNLALFLKYGEEDRSDDEDIIDRLR